MAAVLCLSALLLLASGFVQGGAGPSSAAGSLRHANDPPLHAAGRRLLASKRLPVNAAGSALGAMIHSLQRQPAQIDLPLHDGSFPALLTHRLGIYLHRPVAKVFDLPQAQASWLRTAPAQQLGWQLLGSTYAAGVTAQRLANSGMVVLATARPGCGLGYSAAQIAVVTPTATATAAGVTKNGPIVSVGTRRATASGVFGRCVRDRRVRYYRFRRPAATRLSSNFTQVLLNVRYYPDAQYLFDVAPGGRGDSAVVYYNQAGATTYLVMTYGINTTGWASTAWYLPSWPAGAAAPYSTKLVVKNINFTYSLPSTAVNYYHVPKEDVVTFTPQPGSGGCASCGFWYSDNPKQALAFYVSERSPTAVKGHLLAYAGSPLVAAEPLIDQVNYVNETVSAPYQAGACVPYLYEGTTAAGVSYSGELIWAPKSGPVKSQAGKAVVTFNGGDASNGLVLQYYGKTVRFTKASQYRAGLPVLD